MVLQVRRRTLGADDAHGNAAPTLGAPLSWEVWGLAPGAMQESSVDRDLSAVVWSVLAPKSDDVPSERDVVVVDGDEFEVNGRPKDYTRGPWEHPTAGVVVELKRVEG